MPIKKMGIEIEEKELLNKLKYKRSTYKGVRNKKSKDRKEDIRHIQHNSNKTIIMIKLFFR